MASKTKRIEKHTESPIKHLIITFFVIIGVLLCTIKSNAQQVATNIYTSSDLAGYSSLIGSYNYSYLSFFQGIKGSFFRTGGTVLSTSEVVSIGSTTTTISCKSRINGFFYNQIRDTKILWPLDTNNLQILSGGYKTIYSGYDSMKLTGGLFTDCSGININGNEIYGQIKYTVSGSTTDYYLTAGLKYGSGGISSPAEFTGNLGFSGGNINGLIFDNYGGLGYLGVAQSQSSTQTTVGSQCLSFTGTRSETTLNVTCIGSNVSQYIINLFQSGNAVQSIFSPGNTTYVGTFTLANTGNYIATCTTLIGSNSCNQLNISANGVTTTTGTTNTGTTTTGTITIISYTGTRFVSGIPQIKNAKLKTFYQSADFTIEGITGSILTSISSGYLYINGTGVGTTGYVKNGDILNIELRSSAEYDSTTWSNITVLGITGTFVITTINPDQEVCQLTKNEKSTITNMYTTLKSSYSNNDAKRNNMMYTMKSMIKDVLGFDYNCSLVYLKQLINEDINGNEESTHIAPNCKKYAITYNKDKESYTSSNFKKAQYFVSKESLFRFIDSRNPGDCQINTYTNSDGEYDNTDDTKHIAPNGKVYEITGYDNGLFYSPTISKTKKFSNKDNLIAYIDQNNPAIDVRDHEVDTNFDPITYAAPNNKEYRIYNTDKGFMSYMLLKIKYFGSLEEIKAYIDANNRK